MLYTKEVKRTGTDRVAYAVECDRCHKKYDLDANQEYVETQEFVRIKVVGGFGSVFGDGSYVECDLCQHCLKELIGDICRITG
jgi:antitoxin CcdA